MNRLRAIVADANASSREILEAVALALWHGATGAEVTDIVGHWPNLPATVPDNHPIWHNLP